jgi:hypothetical protein
MDLGTWTVLVHIEASLNTAELCILGRSVLYSVMYKIHVQDDFITLMVL